MSSFRISDTEYYNLRRRRDDSGISFMLSPYSCMSPVSLYIDQIRREVAIYLRSNLLYKGIADLSKIKEGLENLNKLNAVEVATLLTILDKDPEARRYVTGIRSPIDRLIFSLAYESFEELKRTLDETMRDVDQEKVLYLLQAILDTLPYPLREPMERKLRIYLQKDEERFELPWIKEKKKKKKKLMVYA
ncbi:MAG: hypothetical protein QMD12_03265 [Candidatus Aenigmarchaeota archaeon]|nr:hypothetical protein [Candidatus Aenigmarchaeota archaeon]